MAEPSPAITVPDILSQRVAQSPNAVAFSYEADSAWRDIRWGDFSERVNALARALRGRGLALGEHVGILAPTGLGWELFHHAILSAGGVVVGLEPHDTAERLQWVASHAELRILVVHDATLLGKLTKEQIADYRSVILLRSPDGTALGGNIALWTVLEAEGTQASGVLPTVAPEAPATLIYTSGTTGQPKGILYRHEQVTLAVHAITQAYPSFSVGARFVCWLPLSNLFQRIMNLAAMKVGGTVYLVSNPLAVLKALPVAQPDVFIGVPRFYEKLYEGIRQQISRKPRWIQMLVRAAIRTGDRVARDRREHRGTPLFVRSIHRIADTAILRKLRLVMGGGIRFMVTGSAPTPTRLLEFFDAIGLPLYEAYGMSENIVPIALNRPDAVRIGTVGKPLPENSLRIDADGEVLVRGAGVFRSYFKEGLRSELFTDEGYYRTGDLGTLEGEYLRLVGRKSEIIKTSTGRRVSPLAVEALLQELPEVDRAVVFGAGRKCLVALLTLNPASSESLGDGSEIVNDSGSRGERNSPQKLAHKLQIACSRVSTHEQPAGYLILTRPLSIEENEITPNLKLKRSVIDGRYAKAIDALYSEIEQRSETEPLVMYMD